MSQSPWTFHVQGAAMKRALEKRGVTISTLEAAELFKEAQLCALRFFRWKKRRATGTCEGGTGMLGTPKGQRLLREAKRLRRKPREGQPMSFAKVAQQLDSMGLRAPRGGRITASVVRRFLSRGTTPMKVLTKRKDPTWLQLAQKSKRKIRDVLLSRKTESTPTWTSPSA